MGACAPHDSPPQLKMLQVTVGAPQPPAQGPRELRALRAPCCHPWHKPLAGDPKPETRDPAGGTAVPGVCHGVLRRDRAEEGLEMAGPGEESGDTARLGRPLAPNPFI